MNALRTFITHRNGTVVTIREVEPGSCAFTFNRADAWEQAQRDALPAKSSQDPKRKLPARIEFQALDGMTTVVQTSEATQAVWEAVNAPTPVEVIEELAPPITPVTPAAWIDQDPSNAKAIEHLRAQQTAGRSNEFVDSLLSYFDRKGHLTTGQRDAVLRGIERYEAAKASGPIPDVPAGRYAVETEEGHLAFYCVDRPDEGKWAGYTFVKVMASDEEHAVKGAARNAVLAKIVAAGPKAASIRYGQEIGCCGVCGRTLTDEESRAKGIGPICAAKAF